MIRFTLTFARTKQNIFNIFHTALSCNLELNYINQSSLTLRWKLIATISCSDHAVYLSAIRDIQRVFGSRIHILEMLVRSSVIGTCEGIDVVCIHMHARHSEATLGDMCLHVVI